MGPDALRVAQLPAALRALGVDVVDTGNLAGPVNPRGGRDPKAAGLRNLPEAVFWTQAVHDAVLAQSVQATQRIATLNKNVEMEMINIFTFQDFKNRYDIMSVPAIIIDDQHIYFGEKTIEDMLEIINK